MEETKSELAAPAIKFEIGGQVKTSAAVISLSSDNNFNFVGGSITSLDLDDVQPPSEMEGISYLTHRMESPQMSSLRNRRGLPSTLVARRAIAGGHNLNHHQVTSSLLMKSVESVASHSNLENVAPPSLMDELLDSMISVDSITSEVASDPLKRTLGNGTGNVEISHYETALSDNEDTMTLRSCHDLPLDGSSSNCSSNVSTPVKKRAGSITPKMKREMAKDRYRTYTVKVPGTEDQQVPVEESATKKTNCEETLTEENENFEKTPTPERVQRMSAKQRRQENRSRFQTQILDYSEMKIFEITPKIGDLEEGKQIPEEEAMETGEALENNANEFEGPVAVKRTTTVIKKTLMKLIKPNAENSSTSSPTANDLNNKTVRGRRKPDYVSPYRRPATTTTTTGGNQSPSHKAKSGLSSPKVTTNGAIKVGGAVQKEQNSPQKKTGLISKLKMVATKKSPTKEKEKKKDEGSPKELNRQGTFTKDEPSNENIPKVTSLPATPSKKLSKLPLVGNPTGLKKSSTVLGSSGIPRNGGGGVMKRQISAPTGTAIEKRKSLISAPSAIKSSNGQLSERSTSSASIKSSTGTVVGVVSGIKTPNRPTEKKLPLSMPTSRSNSTMGTPRTPTTATTPTTSRISLYGRAKGLIPVTARK